MKNTSYRPEKLLFDPTMSPLLWKVRGLWCSVISEWMLFDVTMHQLEKSRNHINLTLNLKPWVARTIQIEICDPQKTQLQKVILCRVSNSENIYRNSYLKSIKTVAGIRKISLQAMNFRIFCWLAFSFSKRFLRKGKLFELRAFKEEIKIARKHTSYTNLL